MVLIFHIAPLEISRSIPSGLGFLQTSSCVINNVNLNNKNPTQDLKFIPGHMTDILNISFWCNFTISCHKIKSYFTILFFSWLSVMEKSIRINMIRFYIWNRTSQVSIAEQLSDRVIHSKTRTRNLLEAKYQMKSSKRSSGHNLLELPLYELKNSVKGTRHLYKKWDLTHGSS